MISARGHPAQPGRPAGRGANASGQGSQGQQAGDPTLAGRRAPGPPSLTLPQDPAPTQLSPRLLSRLFRVSMSELSDPRACCRLFAISLTSVPTFQHKQIHSVTLLTPDWVGVGRGCQEHPQGIPHTVEPNCGVASNALGCGQSLIQAPEDTTHLVGFSQVPPELLSHALLPGELLLGVVGTRGQLAGMPVALLALLQHSLCPLQRGGTCRGTAAGSKPPSWVHPSGHPPHPSAQTLVVSPETCSASLAALRAAVEMDKEFPSVLSACLIFLWASTTALFRTSAILLLRAAWLLRGPSTFLMPVGTAQLAPKCPFLLSAPRAGVVRAQLWLEVL